MSLHSSKPAVASEHNRRTVFAQATMLALCLVALASTSARADDTGTAAVNLWPVNGQHRGIVLKSQTVDAALLEDQGTVWADTKMWMKLQNPASKLITVTVTLPGAQPSPVPLPTDLSVLVGKRKLELLPAATGENPPSEVTASIGIPARTSVDVAVTYRQPLTDTKGMITYSYLLDQASTWAGTPESLRLTVSLEPPISTSSFIAISQPAQRTEGQTMTWDWESNWGNAGPNVGFVLMSPAWFAEFHAARTAAAETDAGAAEHLQLSRHYGRLASLQSSLLGDPLALHSRYYPAVVAEIQAALDSGSAQSELAEAHSALASLYEAQAGSAQGMSRVEYLQAAAFQIQSALDDGDTNSGVVVLADMILEDLADYSRDLLEGDSDTGYADQSQDIQVYAPDRLAESQAASALLIQATHALALGDTDTARSYIAPLLETVTEGAPAAPPIVSQTTLTIVTTPQGRQIVVDLGRDTSSKDALELASQTADSLREHVPSGGGAVAADNRITVTLPGPPGTATYALQRELAAALPDLPELAVIHAVLANSDGYTTTHSSLLRSTWHLTETVDLAPALRRFESIAGVLDATTSSPPQELGSVHTTQLQAIQHAIWASDADAWRRFANSSTVDYRFELSNSDSDSEWQLQTGEARQMTAQVSQWDLSRLRWLTIGALAAVLLFAAVLWRLI